VLLWGGLMFLWMGLIYPSLKHSSNAFTPRMLVINAVVWTIGGFIFGVAVWFLAERNYIKHQLSAGNKS
jgi:hypothetical protein